MAEGRLGGVVAVVVGAGQTPGHTIGNGRAIATTFAREGAEVLCVDRVAERAKETAASIREGGGVATAFGADVTDDDQCAAIVAHSLERWGRLDVLVNVVGIGGRGDGPAHSVSSEAFERIVDVNLTAMWRMCRAALPSMRERRRGSIVNVSSAASFAGGFQVAYEVSKAGVNRLTTSIAQSNASRGVRCNAIALGLVDTPMAVGGIAAARGVPIETVREERHRQVHGNGVGRSQRRTVPGLGGGPIRDGGRPPRRRGHVDPHRLTQRGCRGVSQDSGRCGAPQRPIQPPSTVITLPCT
jgi:NAD(P)-dependent dehydrogenase (short-subunit alcohol dehydrogenase family)